MVNEADITSYITHLLETIGQHVAIQRDFLTEHIVKHFRDRCPHHNIFIKHHAFKCNKELVDATHRKIEVPWPEGANGKLEFEIDIFKTGVVTFLEDEDKGSVFYGGKYQKSGNKVEFYDLTPVDP